MAAPGGIPIRRGGRSARSAAQVLPPAEFAQIGINTPPRAPAPRAAFLAPLSGSVQLAVLRWSTARELHVFSLKQVSFTPVYIGSSQLTFKAAVIAALEANLTQIKIFSRASPKLTGQLMCELGMVGQALLTLFE